MNLTILEYDRIKIAEFTGKDVFINDSQDMLDLMADSGYNGVNCIILNETNIIPAFFDLKTGIAGDILQKFSNYRMQLAIIGDFSKFKSKSLRDFILESNKTGRVIFVKSREEAIEALLKKN